MADLNNEDPFGDLREAQVQTGDGEPDKSSVSSDKTESGQETFQEEVKEEETETVEESVEGEEEKPEGTTEEAAENVVVDFPEWFEQYKADYPEFAGVQSAEELVQKAAEIARSKPAEKSLESVQPARQLSTETPPPLQWVSSAGLIEQAVKSGLMEDDPGLKRIAQIFDIAEESNRKQMMTILTNMYGAIQDLGGSTQEFGNFKRNKEYTDYTKDYKALSLSRAELDEVLKNHPGMTYQQAHGSALFSDPKRLIPFMKSFLENADKKEATKKQLGLKVKVMPGKGKVQQGKGSWQSYFINGRPNRDFYKLSQVDKEKYSDAQLNSVTGGG